MGEAMASATATADTLKVRLWQQEAAGEQARM